ncbi:RING finger protein [Candidatus Laterigemmans baculatus]|uniref:RING finger protein n=1 Tax=Candidatus Laterigemmans baculatus TaxID=2770505 RepID=UPI0013DC7592|nr:RING finger protein [Candidatus Laterigemmans baculatus]
MNGWILTAILLAIFFWCLVRIGPRRAERTLRRLAREAGGRFLNGGVITPNTVVLHRGGRELRVFLRCISWFGTRYAAEFRAPWGQGRPSVAWSTPTRIRFSDSGPTQPIGTMDPASGSEQLREVARRLESTAAIESQWVWVEASGGHFYSQAILTTGELAPVTAWFATTVQLYDLMMAETEAGIAFSPTRPGNAGAEASCQVCGLPPAAEEIIYCEKCGAPHHADCWHYNRGCAIYGCKDSPISRRR